MSPTIPMVRADSHLVSHLASLTSRVGQVFLFCERVIGHSPSCFQIVRQKPQASETSKLPPRAKVSNLGFWECSSRRPAEFCPRKKLLQQLAWEQRRARFGEIADFSCPCQFSWLPVAKRRDRAICPFGQVSKPVSVNSPCNIVYHGPTSGIVHSGETWSARLRCPAPLSGPEGPNAASRWSLSEGEP